MSQSFSSWEQEMQKAAREGRIEPTEEQWQRIRDRYDQRRNKRSRMRWISLAATAAGFALLILFTTVYLIPRLEQDTYRSSNWEELPEKEQRPIIVPREVYTQRQSTTNRYLFKDYQPDHSLQPDH